MAQQMSENRSRISEKLTWAGNNRMHFSLYCGAGVCNTSNRVEVDVSRTKEWYESHIEKLNQLSHEQMRAEQQLVMLAKILVGRHPDDSRLDDLRAGLTQIDIALTAVRAHLKENEYV